MIYALDGHAPELRAGAWAAPSADLIGKVLLEEEVSKLIDFDEVKEEAIRLAENNGIIFIDEIDKIASKSGKGGGGPDVSREGVQRDLLPIVEGSSVTTKYGVIHTDHVLFIAAGAFDYTSLDTLNGFA
mgnify:CR=1 FL=1